MPLAFTDNTEATQIRRVDLRTVYMKENFDLPDDWRWVSMKVLDHQCRGPKDWRFVQYEGAVYSTLMLRGPRKGTANFKKPDDGTFRVVVVDDQQFRRWLLHWERKTGRCWECQGTGQEWAGWNCETGTRYRDCRRCHATGVPPVQQFEDGEAS